MKTVGYGLELRTKKVHGIEIDVLERSRAAVFGVGNLGTRIARDLAKLGFKLALIDRDKVAAENIGYQELFTKDSIGRNKAQVAASKLKELHPWLDATHYSFEVPCYGGGLENLRNRAKLADKIILDSDISVVSFDSWNPRITVLTASLVHRKPFISVGVDQNEADISVWVPENNCSCLICYTRHISKSSGQQTYVANPNVSELASSLASQHAVRVASSLKAPNLTFINLESSNILEFRNDKANPTCPLCSEKEALVGVYENKGLIGGLEWLVSRI